METNLLIYYRDRVLAYHQAVGIRGLLLAGAAKITGSAHLLKVAHRQIKSPIFLRVPTSDVFVFLQIFLDRQYDFVVSRPPKVIVDAGANTGLAALYFASRYPEATIFAIEPEKKNFELLQRNTAEHPQVIPIHAALWNRNAELNICDRGAGSWGFATVEKRSDDPIEDSVESITVDTLIEKHNIQRIDILKIDVEGAEREVFSEALGWIDQVDCVIVEIHEQIKPGCKKCVFEACSAFPRRWQQGENFFFAKASAVVQVHPNSDRQNE